MTRRVREVHGRYEVTPVARGDVLLDTHAALWWFVDDARLSVPARNAIGDPDHKVYFSTVSAWELATKARIGKLPELPEVARLLPGFVEGSGFRVLPVLLDHATHAGDLPGRHRDPFDRMLIAQATLEGLTVITRDPMFADYGCKVIW
jgi:PIN domain nuclease of toxin-antitoxin system